MADSRLLAIYHRLPYFLRVVVASGRGYYLSRWRYSRASERWVTEALERDSWSAERWQQHETERLGMLLEHAATRVPYYRDQWQARRRAGDKAAWDLLANWPILTKTALRKHAVRFVADDHLPSQMFEEHTSGTTGTPLHLWFEKECVQQWFALFEARTRRWHGVSSRDRWGILGGQLVAAPDAQKPPFWVWNAGLRQLYLSSYHIRAASAAAYIDAIKRHRLVYLLGYASSIHSIAKFGLEQKLEPPSLRVIFSNAEPLFAHQRETIEKFFGCPIRDTYGMAELVAAGGECKHGQMHLWPEVGKIEVLDAAGQAVPRGEFGRFVATGLFNDAMPLIRYELGDSGALASADAVCSCGCQLPLLQQIEGRTDDMIVTPDGRQIGRLDPIFKADLPIREAQIIQERLDLIRLKVVPDERYSAESAADLQALLRQRVGDVQVIVDEVDVIPRTSNGKFRAVISHIAS